jgi:hypothetical protein
MTRRALARAAACLLGLALARPRAALAQRGDDGELIEALIELERRLALAYAVGGSATDKLFARHSRQHAEGLEEALRNRGGRPPAEPRVAGGAPLELEARAVAACHRAAGELRDARLVPTLAAIMANHGQHLVVLREHAGRNPIPAAFETGGVQ